MSLIHFISFSSSSLFFFFLLLLLNKTCWRWDTWRPLSRHEFTVGVTLSGIHRKSHRLWTRDVVVRGDCWCVETASVINTIRTIVCGTTVMVSERNPPSQVFLCSEAVKKQQVYSGSYFLYCFCKRLCFLLQKVAFRKFCPVVLPVNHHCKKCWNHLIE